MASVVKNGKIEHLTVTTLDALSASGIEFTNTSDAQIAAIDNTGNFSLSGYIQLADVSAPVNPAAGEGRLYKKTGDDGLFWKPDVGGAEVDLTTGGGGGSGDFTGPGSSTDNAIVRFDGTDGKTAQNSGVLISDTDDISGVNTLAISGSQVAPLIDVKNNNAAGGFMQCLNSSDDVILSLGKSATGEHGALQVFTAAGNKGLEVINGKIKMGDTVNSVGSDTLLIDTGDINLTSGQYKIGGAAINLSSLDGVTVTSPANDHALVHNGTSWVNEKISRKCDLYYDPASDTIISNTVWTPIPMNVSRILDSESFDFTLNDSNVEFKVTDTYMVTARVTTHPVNATTTNPNTLQI